MDKKQMKALALQLVKLTEEEHGHALGDGLVMFHSEKPAAFLLKAMQLDKALMKREEYQDFVGKTAVFYNSMSSRTGNSDAWVDSAWCLTHYFENFSIADCKDYVHLTDAICYQMNAAAKAYRLAAHCDQVATKFGAGKITGNLVRSMGAMLRVFGDAVVPNVFAIYESMTIDQITAYHEYYEKHKKEWANSKNFWKVPRVKAFLERNAYIELSAFKDKKNAERYRVEETVKKLTELVKEAHAAISEQSGE